jgi:hypothetical protein
MPTAGPEPRQSNLQVPPASERPDRPQVQLEIGVADSDPIPPMRPMPSLQDDPMPQPPDWDAIMGRVGNSTPAPQPNFGPRVTAPESAASPPQSRGESSPATAPELPNVAALNDAPPPLPNVRLNSPAGVGEAGEGLLSEAEGIDTIALKAPPTELSDSAMEWARGDRRPERSAQAPSIFEDPPQLAEAKNYFQETWQPPQGFQDKLEYVLTLNPDGSIQQIVPLGIASRTHIDISGVPLQNTPFVSPLPEAQSLKIRVVLEPDGRILTFAQ